MDVRLWVQGGLPTAHVADNIIRKGEILLYKRVMRGPQQVDFSFRNYKHSVARARKQLPIMLPRMILIVMILKKFKYKKNPICMFSHADLLLNQ